MQAVGCIQLLFAAGLSSTDLAGMLPACGDYSAPVSAEKAAGLKSVRERPTAEIEERQSSLHLLDEVMTAARVDDASQ